MTVSHSPPLHSFPHNSDVVRIADSGPGRRSSPLLGTALSAIAWFNLEACSPRPAQGPSAIREAPQKAGQGAAAPSKPATFRNPVIRGTNPDPSAIRVGEDYYLVSSSFEYFPGVPIHHSKDLVHWEQIGHVLSTEQQLPLEGVPSARGIFAPTLRYHEGTFYMITTNMDGGGSFYVTATNPRGPWSKPFWISESIFTMDPSLFFDDDGKVYYTRHGEGRHGGVFQAEINIATGELAAEPKQIWEGTGGVWPEGPHLYKLGGKYYLLISEGGTSFHHSVTVARADSPWGPFEAYPGNPILTHSNLPEHAIQATGHADLLDTPDGKNQWLVFLGVRPATHRRYHTGRETFLTPLTWSKDGWPVVNGNQPVELSMSTKGLPAWQPFAEPKVREEFDAQKLELHWKFVRNPQEGSWSLTERPGFLRLNGTEASIDDVASPAVLLRAQTDLRMHIATELHFAPEDGQRAGLVIRGNEAYHYDLLVESTNGVRAIVLYVKVAGNKRELLRVPHNEDQATLVVEGYADHYAFFVDSADGLRTLLGSAPTSAMSYEENGAFTGAYLGMYAQSDNGKPAVADFAWFEYKGMD